jgi:hypothetical protein
MVATIDDLIISLEAERDQEKRDRERSLAEVRNILASARGEGRSNVTPEEDQEVERAERRAEDCTTRLVGVEHRLDIATRTRLRELQTDEQLHDRTPNPAARPERAPAAGGGGRTLPAYDRVARIGQEERTYNPGNTRKGGAFLKDVTRQFLYNDIEASARLSRHMQEERVERGQYLERAAGTGAFTGLTVPQYLTDMYAPAVAALRPFADQCNKHDLPPDGMTVNISQITTATSVALQATENLAVSETNVDDTLLTENVQTAAGQQTLSRQAIDRGTGVEEIVMDDLFRRYATTLDSTLLNQATTGLDAVAASLTYTDAAPTGPKIYSQIIGGAATVESTLLGWAQPDLAVMSPRRWYKMLSAVSASWPMILGMRDGAAQVAGVNNGLGYAKGIRGQLANGMNVCVDANMSVLCSGAALTGGVQDHILVVPSQEMHLWEDPAAPVFIRAEQPAAGTLGVLLVLYGYFAYCFRRFPSGATVKINGTGLTTPAFDGT